MQIPADVSRPVFRPSGTPRPRALRRSAGVLGCLLLAPSLGGCDSPAGATPRLALLGTVVRSDTRAPQPGARVALVRYVERSGGGRDRELVAEVVADAGGRYTLSYPVAEGECEELSVQATLNDWQNPNVSSETSPDLKCTAAVQRVDVVLTFSGF